MHSDQLDISIDLVRGLLAEQFPQWAALPIQQVDSTGTVNAIFRLGGDLVVRLPLTPRWHDAGYELWWLELLRARLPVTIPEVVELGASTEEYPFPWAVFTWIEGEPWDAGALHDTEREAHRLAEVVQALWDMPLPTDSPFPPRPVGELVDYDEMFRRVLPDTAPFIDAEDALHVWELALEAPSHQGDDVLMHRDLLPGNVIVNEERLNAIIDWAAVSRGDPARELIAGWTLFDEPARAAFLDALGCDDATTARAIGWVLAARIENVAYYSTSNPRFSQDARLSIGRVVADATTRL